jgi:tetratricopeptide (TPR) repeat protein
VASKRATANEERAIAKEASKRATANEERAIALHDRAWDALDARNLALAERLARRALAFGVRAFGARSLDVANMSLTLGRVCAACGDLAAADRALARAVELTRGARADGDVARLRVYAVEARGALRMQQGRFRDAEPFLRRALAVAERCFARDDAELVGPLNHLGMWCKYTGAYVDGGRYYRRALRIAKATLPATHPTLATLFHNLGGLEHARGRYARAEPFARESVRLRRRARGASHPAVAADEAAYAAILEGLGRLAEAEKLHRHALAIFRRAFGEEHFEVAFGEREIAQLRAERGDARAERLYRAALAKMERAAGRAHPETALTLHNFAAFLIEEGRAREGAPMLRRAIRIWSRTLGARHESVRAARALLAAC